MAAQVEQHKEALQPAASRRRAKISLFAVWNFPCINPGYKALLEAERTGVPLPPDHPARRLPIL